VSHSIFQFNGKVSNKINDMTSNFIELGLLDYPSIIKRPMDFDTLKKNMLAAKFITYEELFLDL